MPVKTFTATGVAGNEGSFGAGDSFVSPDPAKAPKAVAGVDPADLSPAFIDPYDHPDDEDTVWISNIPLPPVGTGRAKCKFPPKAKLPTTGGAGKSHPKVRKGGGEVVDWTISIEASKEAGAALEAAAVTLFPGSGPFPIRHRKARLAHVTHVMIGDWEDAPDWTGEKWLWTIHGKSVKMPVQNAKGGGTPSVVKTPKVSYVDVRPGNVPGFFGTFIAGIQQVKDIAGIGSNDNNTSGNFKASDPGGVKAKAAATKKDAVKP